MENFSCELLLPMERSIVLTGRTVIRDCKSPAAVDAAEKEPKISPGSTWLSRLNNTNVDTRNNHLSDSVKSYSQVD